MDILVFSILTNFLYFCSGSLLISNKKYDFNDQFYIYFSGVILVSFISLLLNFFTPLSSLINSILYIFLIIITFKFKKKNIFNKKSISFLLISSFVTFLLIIYSTINRPDGGLYHLPYTSIINENKIIFGLSNIHFRFGHISILQYLSAVNNNYLFLENGISIPLASIVSFFYLNFFYDILKIIKKKTASLSDFFSLFVLIYIAFKIARYSEFGNDAVAHLSFFYLISCILKDNIKEINFNKILLISVFTFINKPTLGLIFIAPMTIFFLQSSFNAKKIFNSLFSFPALLLYLWLIKNIIVSGCAIYPVKITCIKSLSWTNINKTIIVSTDSEAWSKAWPDRPDQNITMEEFNKNFNWLHSWSKKHLKHILNIIIPYIIILLFIVIFIKFKSKNIKAENNENLNTRFFLCLIICGLGTFSFFFLFPLYRYGYSYIITLISLLFMLIIKNQMPFKRNILFFKFIFISCFIVIISKQTIKFYNNSKNTPWPNIYTLDFDGIIYPKKKIIINNDFFYYLADKGDQLCMYSKSPCTNYPVKNIKYSLKNSYLFLNVN